MARKLILVVDDEEISLEMTAYILEDSGYQVLKALTAKLAIEIVEHNHASLSVILMDLVMPKHDGFVAISTIKSYRIARLIPIMALTSSNDTESFRKAMEAGADDYMMKPFDPVELSNRVHALCKISDFVKRWKAFAR